MAECPNCKKQLDGAAKFCPACGNRLSQRPKCAKCGIEADANANFCAGCGTPIAGVSPTANPLVLTPAGSDGHRMAFGLYRSLTGIYGSYLLERFDAAMQERDLVRRMYILEPGAMERDIDQALYDMAATVPKVLARLNVSGVSLDTTSLYSECKVLLGPVNATVSTLRGIMAEAGIAMQVRGSAGVVAGAVIGMRAKSVWGNVAAAGVGAAYDSAEQRARVRAVASRYNSTATQLGTDLQSTWERVFDKVVTTVGTSLCQQLPGTREIQPVVAEFERNLAQGKHALASSQVSEAVSCATRALSICADDTEALTVRGNAHLRNGNVNDALADAESTLSREPQNAEALLLKAEAVSAKAGSDATGDATSEIRQLLQSILETEAGYPVLLKAALFCDRAGCGDMKGAMRGKAAASVPFILPECADHVMRQIASVISPPERVANETQFGQLTKDLFKRGEALVAAATSLRATGMATTSEVGGSISAKHRALFISELGGLRDGEVILYGSAHWGLGKVTGPCLRVVTTQRVLDCSPQVADIAIELGDIGRCETKRVLTVAELRIFGKNGEVYKRDMCVKAEVDEFAEIMNRIVLPAVGKWVDAPGTPPVVTKSSGDSPSAQSGPSVVLSPVSSPEKLRASGQAKAALVCGIVSATCFGFLAVPFALFFGIKVLRKKEASPRDRKFAKWGVGLAVFSVIATGGIIALGSAEDASKERVVPGLTEPVDDKMDDSGHQQGRPNYQVPPNEQYQGFRN